MRNPLLLVTLMALPLPALAVGSDSDSPPPATPTTTSCAEGLIWDTATASCVTPKDSRLDDIDRMRAVRELAYAGRIPDALGVLDAMDDQSAGMVLTYRGFAARKLGHFDQAMSYYNAALQADPDNHLARSYMAQGLVEKGETDLAQAQLSEIRARGGRGTWAEASLKLALQSGNGFSY